MNRRMLQMLMMMVAWGLFATRADAQSIGSSMVTFLGAKSGVRVGGGEASHMATEALRAAGGEFYPGDLNADYPASGDRSWGSLVVVVTCLDSWRDWAPNTAVLPGDVIQYCGATMGGTTYPQHHTAVVKTVSADDASRPTSVYQQNMGGVRTVQAAAIDVKQLTSGLICIYRPQARADSVNSWKFTVLNQSSSSQAYNVVVGVSTVSSATASTRSTADSFQVYKVSTDGTVPAVVDGDASYYVQNAKGNELCGSPVVVKQLSQ